MVLSPIDYAVIAGYLIAITLFGSWFARFQKTTRDYFLTDRSVPAWAICCSIVATETSTLTFVGTPAQAYFGNMAFLQLAIGYLIGRFVVAGLFIPAYFRGELLTSYELLQRRFGPSVKNLSAVIFLITRSLGDGVRLFTTAFVVALVTQFDLSLTIVILGVAMIIYTMRGGVSAVIWTDVVQLFVYIGGAALVIYALLTRIDGGWTTVVETGRQFNKFQIFDFTLNWTTVYTIWTGLIGGVALTLSTHGTDQFFVQRLLSARSSRDAARGLIASGFIVFAQFTLFLLIGIMLFTYYQQVPLPVTLNRNDEILPVFVVYTLQHGAAGFIVAAIVAAALSPSINAMASTTVNDFYVPYVRPHADERELMRVSKQATVFWGVVQIGVALAVQNMQRSVLDAGLSVLSLASGAVLGAFLLGTMMKRVGSTATLTGMIAGLLAMSGVWLWTPVAWTWYVFIGASTTVIVACVASLVMPADRVPASLSVEANRPS